MLNVCLELVKYAGFVFAHPLHTEHLKVDPLEAHK